MVSFASLFVLCSAAVALASPTANSTRELAKRTTITTSGTGTAGGYYYSLYEEVNSGVSMNIGTGSYSLTWSSASQDVVAGIGWMPGSAQRVLSNLNFSV